MDILNLETLEKWGKDNGLTPRLLESKSGVMFSRRGSKTLFTIYLKNNDAGNCIEIAFNKVLPDALKIHEKLGKHFKQAIPKTSQQWPRVGASTFKKEMLDQLLA